MSLKDIGDFIASLRSQPLRASLLTIALLCVFAGSAWLTGYFQKKGGNSADAGAGELEMGDAQVTIGSSPTESTADISINNHTSSNILLHQIVLTAYRGDAQCSLSGSTVFTIADKAALSGNRAIVRNVTSSYRTTTRPGFEFPVTGDYVQLCNEKLRLNLRVAVALPAHEVSKISIVLPTELKIVKGEHTRFYGEFSTDRPKTELIQNPPKSLDTNLLDWDAVNVELQSRKSPPIMGFASPRELILTQ